MSDEIIRHLDARMKNGYYVIILLATQNSGKGQCCSENIFVEADRKV